MDAPMTFVCSECGARVAKADVTVEVDMGVDPEDIEAFIAALEVSTSKKILRKTNQPSDTGPLRYHHRDEVRGSGRRNVIGCHIERVRCGPLREPTPADLYEEQLEAAFGPL